MNLHRKARPFSLPEKEINSMASVIAKKFFKLQEPGHNRDKAVQAALGAALVSAKQRLGHGEFQRFVVELCPFGRRQARRYMAKHRHYEATKDLPPPEPTEAEAELFRSLVSQAVAR